MTSNQSSGDTHAKAPGGGNGYQVKDQALAESTAFELENLANALPAAQGFMEGRPLKQQGWGSFPTDSAMAARSFESAVNQLVTSLGYASGVVSSVSASVLSAMDIYTGMEDDASSKYKSQESQV